MSCEMSSPALDPPRDERRWPDEHGLGTHERERLGERPRDARVQHVTDDRDAKAVEPAERPAHRVQVEKSLGRMLVLAVACIHDVCSVCRTTSCGAPIDG